MSKISTAYDELNTILIGLFPNKIQLANAISIEQNTDAALKDGYGIHIGPGLNTNRHVSCKMSLQRGMTIILTIQSFANELRTAERYVAMKALLEEHFILTKRFENDPTLTTAGNFVFLSDAGIQQVINESNQFFKIETLFKMEYFEDLT